MIEQKVTNSDNTTFIVHDDPVIQTAMEVLELFRESNIVVLKGKGKTIPNTVAVANIIIDNFLKDRCSAKKIDVDSEIPDNGKMVSNIVIILEKNN